MITVLTVAMVGAALLVWRRTGSPWAAIVVVAVFMLAVFAAGLIP